MCVQVSSPVEVQLSEIETTGETTETAIAPTIPSLISSERETSNTFPETETPLVVYCPVADAANKSPDVATPDVVVK